MWLRPKGPIATLTFIGWAAVLAAFVAATPAWAGKQRNAEAAREHAQRGTSPTTWATLTRRSRSSRPRTSWCSIQGCCSTSRRLTGRAGTPERALATYKAYLRTGPRAAGELEAGREMAGRTGTCARHRTRARRRDSRGGGRPVAGGSHARAVRFAAHGAAAPAPAASPVPAPPPPPARVPEAPPPAAPVTTTPSQASTITAGPIVAASDAPPGQPWQRLPSSARASARRMAPPRRRQVPACWRSSSARASCHGRSTTHRPRRRRRGTTSTSRPCSAEACRYFRRRARKACSRSWDCWPRSRPRRGCAAGSFPPEPATWCSAFRAACRPLSGS